MKRKELKAIAKEVACELEEKPVSFWQTITFPHVYSEKRKGVPIDIELELLEDEPGYLHIGVALDDDNWLRKLAPVGTSFIVEKR